MNIDIEMLMLSLNWLQQKSFLPAGSSVKKRGIRPPQSIH
jgi:hypothetical protein